MEAQAKQERIRFWEFTDPEDRDSTVVIFLVFILLVATGWLFRDKIGNEAGFIVGTLLGYFGAIVQRFFKKGNPQPNGEIKK